MEILVSWIPFVSFDFDFFKVLSYIPNCQNDNYDFTTIAYQTLKKGEEVNKSEFKNVHPLVVLQKPESKHSLFSTISKTF